MTNDELKIYLRLIGAKRKIHLLPELSASWFINNYQLILHEHTDSNKTAIYRMHTYLANIPNDEVPEFLNDNIPPIPASNGND